MTSPLIPMVVATMAVTFAVSFAVLWDWRAPRSVAGPIGPVAIPWHLAARATAAPPPPPPSAATMPGAPPPLPAVASSDDGGPPLPVLLSVSVHPGSPHDEDPDASSAGMPQVSRQIDLISASNEPLDVTISVIDLPTQASTRTALFVPPNAQAHVGTDFGLKIEPGNIVTLRSRGFSPLTQTVH